MLERKSARVYYSRYCSMHEDDLKAYAVGFAVVAVITLVIIAIVAVSGKKNESSLLKSTVGDGMPAGWELRMTAREGMVDTDKTQFRAIGMGSGPRDGMSGSIKIIVTGEFLGNTGETVADIGIAWSTRSNRPSRGDGLEIPRVAGLELIKVGTLSIRSDKSTGFEYQAKIPNLPGASYWFDLAAKTADPRVLMFHNVVMRIWGG